MKKKIVGIVIVLVVLVFLIIGTAFVCKKSGAFDNKGTDTGIVVSVTPPPFITSDVPIKKSTKLVTPLPTPEGGYDEFEAPTPTPNK